jgi:glycosyltransferase involved in cell wall biosynthesis
VSGLRVLAVANWDAVARPIAWAEQRLEALRRAGVDVDLLAIECCSDRRGYLRLWTLLQERVASGRYDLVAPLYGSIVGLLCTLQRRVPCVVSFAGSDLIGPQRSSLELLSVPASQLSALFARGVSVHNARMRSALWWPPARARCHVLSDGIDTQRFVPRARAEARRRRGLPLDGTRILFVGAEVEARPIKRPELARAAVARLPGATLEVASHVPFAEMPWVYPSADALVLTSLAEGSPNCVKEALACGLPVVAVDAGDVREIVEGLTNCAVVAPEADAIARALSAVLADGRGCPEGPARVASRYSLEATGARFLRLFESALATDCTASSPTPSRSRSS